MTAQDLKSRSLKDLVQLAKRYGVSGWHAMKKDALVKALARAIQRKAALAAASRHKTNGSKSHPHSGGSSASGRNGSHLVRNGASRNGASRHGSAIKLKKSAHANGSASHRAARNGAARHGLRNGSASRTSAGATRAKLASAQASQRIRQLQLGEERRKNLATAAENGRHRDRLVALVRDPFWLHAYWDLSRQTVERARVAMGQDWHTAQPVLRLSEVCSGEGTSSVERLLRDIPIHGGVNNWYVDVKDPPKSFRLDIGYRAASGKFFSLARSNVVSTPKAGTSDALDNNWNDVAANFDKIYAMNGGSSENGADSELEELFEERLRRPLNSSTLTEFAVKVNGHRKHPAFNFEIDAELIVFGTTEPDAQVTLHGEPIEVRKDGSFTVRYNLPNCRQVIPAVARSGDGLEQRTIVLAVERNTKTMEPVVRESGE
jgi:hypothetical protein